ncbi:MAG: hypothetical protein IT378_21715 [Sandaracinaceae bacterium]|nr:hypothetical protein [Sandaracinaceae bacterium]
MSESLALRPRPRVLVLLAVALAGCGPVLVWHGRSPDRAREARLLEEGGAQRVVVDRSPHPAFDAVAISQLRWAGRAVVYPARSQDRWHLVADGVAGPAFEGLGEVVTHGDRVAYVARDGEGWRVVAGGEPGPVFQSIRRSSLRFVGDAARLLYVGRDERGEHVVIDGEAGEAFDQIEHLRVGAKGTMIAYVGWARDGASVVVEREVRARYDEVLALEVADHEPRWAALVTRRGAGAVVHDANVIAERPGLMDVRIAAEGTHVAFTAADGGQEALFVDGREVARHRAIEEMLFVPCIGALVYVARDADGVRVVHDGVRGPRVTRVASLVASPAGHFGYVAEHGAGRLVMIDGALRFRGEWAGALVLAERGDRYAFVTRHGARRFVVTPDRSSPIGRPFVDTLVLDPEGAHWAIAIADRRTRRVEVWVDGAAVAPLDLSEVAAGVTQERDPVEVVRTIVAGELARVR